MNTRSDFPSCTLRFDSKGAYASPAELQEIIDMVTDEKITDLIVMSHGWKNNEAEATAIYSGLLSEMRKVLQNAPLGHNRTFGVLEIIWPSELKKFWLFTKFLTPDSQLGEVASSDSNTQIMEQFDQLELFFEEDEAKKSILRAGRQEISCLDDTEAAIHLIKHFKQLLPIDEGSYTDPVDNLLIRINPEEGKSLLKRLHVKPKNKSNSNLGRAAVISDAVSDKREGTGEATFSLSFRGIAKGTSEFLNICTYYWMRERAYIIGTQGLHPALFKLKQEHPNLKLHLVGHSFGALLVTSSVLGPKNRSSLTVDTLTLLQAAFSHFSFAPQVLLHGDGRFRPALLDIKGPVLISYSHKDQAVGIMYALASALANQVALQTDDETVSLYGGLGRNGAQGTPESSDEFILDYGNTSFSFMPGKVYNLKADGCIRDHNDVVHYEVAYAILSAISTT